MASERSDVDDLLLQHDGIWGTAFSTKIIDGVDTGEPCFTAYVSHKLNEDTLDRKGQKKIPSEIKVNHKNILIDVVRLGRSAEEQMYSPTKLADGRGHGSLSFFSAYDDSLYGVTCAHCAKGSDGNIKTPATISYAAIDHGIWDIAGRSIENPYYAKGIGIHPEYGFADATLFSIENQNLLEEISVYGEEVEVYPAPTSENEIWNLLRQPVYGNSVFNYQLSARVSAVYLHNHKNGSKYDVVIRRDDDEGLTKKRDSGMSWYTESGYLLSIHARAKPRSKNKSRSHICYGMFAERVVNHYGITPITF